MTLYAVFVNPRGRPSDAAGRSAYTVVPDGFSLFAALLPPVFAAAHRLWWAVPVYLGGLAAIVLLSVWVGFAASWWLYCLFAVLWGLEAGWLRSLALRRAGWRKGADLVAGDDDLAELEWLRLREAGP